jgi:Holliday junction DNA helicase RuvA
LFAYLKGSLANKYNDYLVVEVNGIGYRVFTALSTLESIGSVGDEVKVFTHLYVREDNISLYGFCTEEELGMFELLIGVSGVGPKVAISVLASMTPSRFSLAVITDDVKTLTKAQGIGTKTAQRIILELKDKIKKEQLTAKDGIETDKEDMGKEGSRVSEAISALMILGYTSLEAQKAVMSVYSEDIDLEVIIKNALKGLARS